MNLNDYMDLDEIVKKYPKHFTKNQLRWLVQGKENFGLSHAIIKIGRKLYFNVPLLIQWVVEGGFENKIKDIESCK